jgi:calcineurin-like phosphoesterase family protein
MQAWFTADLHLGHGNIIRFCDRPFLSEAERAQKDKGAKGRLIVSQETVARHDDALIDAINERVAEDDLLWILGDFCMGGLAQATEYRGRIRCRNVHLAAGNHDHHSVRPVFTSVIEQGLYIHRRQDIWLSHYPMRSWHRSYHGAWHLYGHVHGILAAEDERDDWRLTRDVGVDACGYRPVSFDEIAAYMAPREARFRERKAARAQGADLDVVS